MDCLLPAIYGQLQDSTPCRVFRYRATKERLRQNTEEGFARALLDSSRARCELIDRKWRHQFVFSVLLVACGVDHTIARRCGLQLNLCRKARFSKLSSWTASPSLTRTRNRTRRPRSRSSRVGYARRTPSCLLRRNTTTRSPAC